jgi:hypothetical protein
MLRRGILPLEGRKVGMDPQQQSPWGPTRRQLLWTGGIVGFLTVVVLIGYRYDITLWDWLKLLIVPAVIAAGGVWFNRQQREREVEIAERHTQDEALQAYLDQLSDILIPSKDQPSLHEARRGDSLSTVIRARTLTVLSRLDGTRKARVVQFLRESGLIYRDPRGSAVLELRGADLRGTDLVAADLVAADLSSTDLSGANLVSADLTGADLSSAILTAAEGVTDEQLAQAACLEGATMPDGQMLKRGNNPDGPTFEEWLKSKGREEDAENSGLS